MAQQKKILSTVIKVIIGLGSLAIVGYRLNHEFTADKLEVMRQAFSAGPAILLFMLCIALIPVNWGTESFKWKIITAPVQPISLARANRSVYSGLCLGNFAPGKATEFIGKIIFFEAQHRARIATLHFVGGLFQLLVTVGMGLCGLFYLLNDLGDAQWLLNTTLMFGLVLLSLLLICLFKARQILNYVAQKINREEAPQNFNYTFTPAMVCKLFLFSLLRFFVFSMQFALLLFIFHPEAFTISVWSGIWVYFLVTTSIPMFSLAEPAIRTAVAMLAFTGIESVDALSLTLCTILLWLLNIVLPSLLGYYFLVKENFDFKFKTTRASGS